MDLAIICNKAGGKAVSGKQSGHWTLLFACALQGGSGSRDELKW